MKALLLMLTMSVLSPSQAVEVQALSAEQMKAMVAEVTNAQNDVMMRGSTLADVEALFALYNDDFLYIHEAYGGTYTREELYRNTVKLLESGRYDRLSRATR
jgi:hypothetical protein